MIHTERRTKLSGSDSREIPERLKRGADCPPSNPKQTNQSKKKNNSGKMETSSGI